MFKIYVDPKMFVTLSGAAVSRKQTNCKVAGSNLCQSNHRVQKNVLNKSCLKIRANDAETTADEKAKNQKHLTR